MVQIDSSNFELQNEISIEIQGAIHNPGIFEISREMTFEDLKDQLDFQDDADLSSISSQKTFVHQEILVIPEIKETSKISINSATKEELMSLKGIGEVLAEAIIDYRNEHHGFKDLKDLLEVKGIGEKKFEAILNDISL